MKSSKIAYGSLAIVLAGIILQQSGAAASYGGATLSLLSGTYASTFSGYSIVSDSLQPFAGTGLFISDGDGNLSGHETVNFNGNACNYQIDGAYTIASDGTGTDAINFVNGGTGCPSGSYTQSLVVVDSGDMILLSNTNSPDVATEHWYRTVSEQPFHHNY
jgi:hypothetical protein